MKMFGKDLFKRSLKKIALPVLALILLALSQSIIITVVVCIAIYYVTKRILFSKEIDDSRDKLLTKILKGDSSSYLCRKVVVNELYLYPTKNIIVVLKPLKVVGYMPIKISRKDFPKVIQAFNKLNIDSVCICEGDSAILLVKYSIRAIRLSHEVLEELAGGLAARLAVLSEYAESYELSCLPASLDGVKL